MKWSNRPYEKVATTESENPGSYRLIPTSISRSRVLVAHFNLAFLVFNTLCFSALVWTTRQSEKPNAALKRVNSYTPLLDRYDFTFHTRTPNASLFNIPYSIYKDDPSPAVDAAWEDVADTPVLVISRDDVVRMGKDPEYATEVPVEFGYGTDKVFAVNDGQHLIHCLNEVRKFAYSSYYYPNITSLPSLQAAHRSHCIGILLDALRCQPSLNVVLWEWIEGSDFPEPDFAVERQCVDQSAFRKWMDETEVDRDVMRGWSGKWDGGRSRNGGLGGKTRVKVVPPEVKSSMGMGEAGHDHHHAHSGIL